MQCSQGFGVAGVASGRKPDLARKTNKVVLEVHVSKGREKTAQYDITFKGMILRRCDTLTIPESALDAISRTSTLSSERQLSMRSIILETPVFDIPMRLR